MDYVVHRLRQHQRPDGQPHSKQHWPLYGLRPTAVGLQGSTFAHSAKKMQGSTSARSAKNGRVASAHSAPIFRQNASLRDAHFLLKGAIYVPHSLTDG